MENKFPLTESQIQIWAGQQLNPAAPLYHMAFAFQLQGSLDPDAFVKAFQLLLEQCDAMRMVFVEEEGVAQQAILPKLDFELAYLDWSEEGKVATLELLQEKIQEPFDLSQRLFDALLIKVGATDFIWYLNQHHLITDGWSKTIQFQVMADCYQQVVKGENGLKKNLPSIREYVLLKTGEDKKDLSKTIQDYWKRKQQSAPAIPAFWNKKNTKFTTSSQRFVIDLGSEKTTALRSLVESPNLRLWSEDLSLYTVFASLLFIYTAKISGRQKLSIGSPVHNRRRPRWKQTPGLFIELFPMTLCLEEQDTYQTVFEKVRTEYFEFLKHAQSGASNASLSKTFNVVFNYINTSFPAFHEFSSTADWLDTGHSDPGHYLKLQVHDFNATGSIQLMFDVNMALLEGRKMESIAADYQHLLAEFMADANAKIDLLTAAEREQLALFNQTDFQFPNSHQSIVDLFETQVTKRPDQTAIVFEDQQLSFTQLNEKANQLAHYLESQTLAKEELVAICLDRSLEMMIALLGVLKAGAAYVPIDPRYPLLRIQQMLGEAEPRWVITNQAQGSLFEELGGARLLLLEEEWREIEQQSNANLNVAIDPENLMYVIYTSGSTGRPKGVMNEHGGVVNRLLWTQEQFQLRAGKDVVLQKTNFCFDVSVWELFWPLIAGVQLVFARPEGHKDNQYLKQAIDQYGISTIHFVPTMLEVFLLDVGAGDCATLSRVLCSGEALKSTHLKAFKESLPHTELHNLYGPTEAAIDVTHWPVADFDSPLVSIGKPVTNTQLHILNEWGKRCPIGVPGELHIAGVQVARGYYKRPELTHEKFIPNPFATTDQVRMYKTGDLASWLPDGNIQFLGRMDTQVKVRGFRIELTEIEGALQEHTGISQAVVLAAAAANDQQRLLAFVVGAQTLKAEELRQSLVSQLPDYMIPALFFFLAEIPFTPNGKINRAKLLTWATQQQTETDIYQAPKTEFEEIIQDIWLEVFQLDKIGTQVDFIQLGGDSLLAIRLISRINTAFELQLPANLIFQHPNIAEMAIQVEETIRTLLLQIEDMDS